MEARPCQILEFFNGTKQMLVPLFQRPYEWGPKDWDTLWADLFEQYERTEQEATTSHFTGAIVTAPARSVPVGVSKHLVIDGQQRLTTVAILVCAMRAQLGPDTPKYRKLTRLLVNEDDEGLDHFKLLPTQPDRAAFQAIVAGNPLADSQFTRALDYFAEKLGASDSDGNAIDVERMFDALQSRLSVVNIHLGETDDPYLIFESLNAKGTPLTQADLIRNYLLLRLHAHDQKRVYEELWLPMQGLLPGEQLTEFMRQFLMLAGEEVPKSAIYAVLKKRLLNEPESDVASVLARMHRAASLYAHITGGTPAADHQLATALARLRRWEVATANPVILKLLDGWTRNVTPLEDLIACLATIESFAVRRTICGVPTNQLKRIFLSVVKDMPQHGAPAWLARTLAAGSSGRRWPKDDEFREALLRYRAYAQPIDRCKFILEEIEGQHGHKERTVFDAATIEHVMPQTLTPAWRAMLGPEAERVHERWLDVLGNLTLTAYNSELSNSPFARKQTLLAASHFEMNKWIAGRQTWTEVELAERSELLFELARRSWPRPSPE